MNYEQKQNKNQSAKNDSQKNPNAIRTGTQRQEGKSDRNEKSSSYNRQDD